MIRRLLVAAVVSLCLVLSANLAAQKGGGAHGSSHGSGSAQGSAPSKPVHVKAYTKKDGTKVEAHDRNAPESNADDRPSLGTLATTKARHGAAAQPDPAGSEKDRGNAEPPLVSLGDLARIRAAQRATTVQPAPALTNTPPRVSTSPIHIVIDPVTGRKTFTNEPIPASPMPTPAASRVMTIPPTAAAAPATRSSTAPRSPRVSAATARATSATGTTRTADGRIARSQAAKHAFEVQTGYAHGRPGYVIDHIKPLACGGVDAPRNMQWQTIAAAKAKDKIERVGCR